MEFSLQCLAWKTSRGLLSPVPEPGNSALMALGLVAVGTNVQRRRAAAA